MSAKSNTRRRIVQLPKKQKEPEPTQEVSLETVETEVAPETATLDDLFSDETYNDSGSGSKTKVEPVLSNKTVFIKTQEIDMYQNDYTETQQNVVHLPVMNNKNLVNKLTLNNKGLVDNRKN